MFSYEKPIFRIPYRYLIVSCENPFNPSIFNILQNAFLSVRRVFPRNSRIFCKMVEVDMSSVSRLFLHTKFIFSIGG